MATATPNSYNATSPVSQNGSRKRDYATANESSPASVDSLENANINDQLQNTEGRGRKAVKRACNECRQQKLRCDVIQEPFKTCSRCSRLRLDCKIEENFKRIGKRSRNAEMEREIVELRRQVAARNNDGANSNVPELQLPQNGSHNHDAVAGLLDLRNSPGKQVFKRLEDVTVTSDQVDDLFRRFFNFNHPFLPFLDPERPPDEYFKRSPLLFWTVVTIGARHYTREPNLFEGLTGPLLRLVWATISEVPQNHHIVKALALLCAWPLPSSSTSTDPMYLFCGLMMSIALQIGLHRPDHAQDFSKFKLELRRAELQDRVVAWAVCNIVAQRIATAAGQPTPTIYDWTLRTKPLESNPSYELPSSLWNHLQIEKFIDKVSKTVYENPRDPVGLPDDDTRSQVVRVLDVEHEQLAKKLQSDDSPITQIYLRAAALHLHLSAFFSHRDLSSYNLDMLRLYHVTTEFLETCLSLESETSVSLASSYSHGLSLSHATNYIFHALLAAGFSLLKLMHYFLKDHKLDLQGAEGLFTRTIWALRSTSVMENDLSERLAEVLAQVWKSGPMPLPTRPEGADESDDEGGPLQLKVRCRRSMSLVFDSVWRWRKNFRDQRVPNTRFFRQNNQDALPTPVEATTRAPALKTRASSAIQMHNTDSLSPAMTPIAGMAGMPTGMVEDYGAGVTMTGPNSAGPDYGSTNYEVFDPLNWMLDGVMDFPYNFSAINPIDSNNNSSLGSMGIGMGTDGL